MCFAIQLLVHVSERYTAKFTEYFQKDEMTAFQCCEFHFYFLHCWTYLVCVIRKGICAASNITNDSVMFHRVFNFDCFQVL